MTEIWVKIKGFKNYSISNKGRVRNDKTKKCLKQHTSGKSSLLKVSLSKKGEAYNRSNRSVHVLVARAFGKMKSRDNSALHLNYIQFDNREPNIEGCTVGEAIGRTIRYNKIKKNKLFGVYPWYTATPGKNWRAQISKNDGKSGFISLGYFKTKKEAIEVFYHAM